MDPLNPNCKCPLRPKMSKKELLEEIYIPKKNCCHPQFICPVLDKEMRRAEKETSWKKYQSKDGAVNKKKQHVVTFDELGL